MKLIVSDIEGCLMPATRQKVNSADLAGVAAYCAAARKSATLPPLIFCTGRQIPYAECVAQFLGAFFPQFPSVVENGAFLYNVATNEITPNLLLTPDKFSLMRDVCLKTDKLIDKYRAKKEYGKEVCISLNPPAEFSIEEFFGIVEHELANWSEELEITHSRSAVDITPKNINKASGVRHLAQMTGISLDEMLGIGDTRGDLPMLKIVGTPTAPANASPEIKEMAKFISLSSESKGVAEILRRFTLWK